MDLLLQTLTNGFILGAAYALVAVGLTLVFGVLHIVNFAHGAFFALGAYAVLLLKALGIPYLLTLPLAVLCVAGIGWVVELTIVRKVIYERSEHGSIIVTFAVGQALTTLVILILGPDPYPVASPFSQATLSFGNFFITEQRLIVTLTSVATLAVFGTWLRLTTKGQQLQAVSQNPRGALYSGIKVPTIRSICFVLGVAAAGLAGALIAPVMTAFPTMGDANMVVAFTVVILGGLGSIPGALVSALLIGIANALFETYVSVSLTPALGWILVIAVLLVRPQGVLGKAKLNRH